MNRDIELSNKTCCSFKETIITVVVLIVVSVICYLVFGE